MRRTTLIALLLASIVFAGCIGTGDVSLLGPVQQSWIGLALVVIFGMYMAIALLYMVATGLGMPGLLAWCKNELFQITATAIMVFMLAFAITGADEISRSFTASGNTAMVEAQDYMLCQTQTMWSTYNLLIVSTAPLQILYSSTIHIRPMKMGFSLQPAKFLQPIMDNVGIAITMLTSATWASKLIYNVLLFAGDTMLLVFLPLGVLLRSVPFTRSIGGALIAIAVSFYIALPAAVLINSMVYEEHYGAPCVPNRAGGYWAPERLQAVIGGFGHYFVNAGLAGTEGTAPAVFGKAGLISYLLLAVMFGGSIMGGFWWLISGAVIGALISWFLAWAREVVFLVVILGFAGMVLDYMITFTFARELGKILGADINLGALMKIL